MSEIQKSLKFPMGGGGQAYLGIFPKFFRFFLLWLPLVSSNYVVKTLKLPNLSMSLHILSPHPSTKTQCQQ